MELATTARAHWTLSLLSPPKPWLTCAACGGPRPFAPTGKARLNANGKRLDAWLIYRCETCGGTWNRPILSRRPVGDVDHALLAALQTNEPGLLTPLAFDLAALRRFTTRIEQADEIDLIRQAVLPLPPDPARLSIRIEPGGPLPVRTDRLIARGLGISRSRVVALAAEGRLIVDAGPAALSRPVGAALTVDLKLADLTDSAAIVARATGSDQPAP